MAQGGRQGIKQPLGGADPLPQPPLGRAGLTASALELLSQGGLAQQVGELVQPADRPQGLGNGAPPPRRFRIHGARMISPLPSRPVSSPAAGAPPRSSGPAAGLAQRRCWPSGSRDTAEALHRLLAIGDRDWHALKGQPRRRAAEQLAAALVQLLAAEPGAAAGDTGAQELALIESAGAWLRGSQRDPGCPRQDH